MAVDFFTVETVWLQRLYVLFFIELGRFLVTKHANRARGHGVDLVADEGVDLTADEHPARREALWAS